MSQHSKEPSHGRGSAASQGEKIRLQREQQQANRNSQIKSTSNANSNASSPKTQSKQLNETVPSRKQDKPVSDSNQAAAAAAVTPVGDKDSEKKSTQREATRDPSGKGLKIEKRIFNASGIDNLALLLETDDYHPACFSIYRFKTILDQQTIHDFFHALMKAYPRFAYLVELDPSLASKHNKEAQASTVDPSQRDLGRSLTDKQKKELEEKRKGRRTRYSKSLKAGGLFRPAKFRHDPRFSIDNQIEEVDCPGIGSDEDLNSLAGKFLARHFDYTKPLWEALVVRNIKNSAEGTQSALLIKVHHTLSDGQGMIAAYHTVLTSMATGQPVSQVQAKFDAATAGRQQSGSEKTDEKKDEQKAIGQRGIKPTIWGTTTHTFHTIRGLYFSSRKSFEYNHHSTPRSAGRLYSQSEGILMSDIKLIRQAFSTEKIKLTLNDVACAVLTRGMRIAAERTESRKGKKIKDKRLAIFVPISVRPKGDWSLNNYTTGGIAWFRFTDPNKENSFEELLSQVNREMTRIKKSHIPKIWYSTFGTFCKRRFFYLPNYPVFKSFFNKAYREYSVATNVPGPNQPVKFGQHEAHSYHVLPPSSPGKSTMAIGMISYGGHFSVAVSVDDVPEFKTLPQDICKAFQDSAAELVQAAKKRLGQEK